VSLVSSYVQYLQVHLGNLIRPVGKRDMENKKQTFVCIK